MTNTAAARYTIRKTDEYDAFVVFDNLYRKALRGFATKRDAQAYINTLPRV